MHKINGLTGLRGYAALWVMLFHSFGVISTVFGVKDHSAFLKQLNYNINFDISPLFTGWGGVEIFFVLTGFLLFLPFVSSPAVDLKHYFKRRACRILPAYYTQITILLLLASCGLYENASLVNWLAHIFMIHNFSSAWSGMINGVWWTLPIEVNFYLLLPLLFIFIKRKGIWIFFLLSILIVTAYKFLLFPYIANNTIAYKSWMFYQIPGRLDLFAYGMLAASLYQKYRDKFISAGESIWIESALLGGGLIGMWQIIRIIRNIGNDLHWGGCISMYISDTLFGFMVFIIVLALAMQGKIGKIIFANRPILYIGEISYSLYLWHPPILILIFYNKKILPLIHSHMIESIIIYTVTTLYVASISYRYIEYPFMCGKINIHNTLKYCRASAN